ncbi:AfsR/SARP family transcriptional regulator [Nonomuraea sp. NPDC050404]|uniref:AfsR/SARP family transcriptional regulator n=1 Tax=Nonomuraea sp. NPDC050404 TaxID=3155783 RepID=UPI0033C0758A
MRFRILGPLVVERDGRELHLGGLRRTILGLLLLQPGEVVPLDRMIEAVWGENPPDTARNQIQIRISQLRRLLDDTANGRLITQAPGYLIRPRPGESDLAEFFALVARAKSEEPAQAIRTLRRAGALWRGPALCDIDNDALRPGVLVLEEHRRFAVRRRIELELGLGRHARLVGELRLLVEDYPLCEPSHRFLMIALYRAGRQAEALEVFHAYRRTLSDALGLDPSDELCRVHSAMLNREPVPHTTAPDAATPPPVTGGPIPRQLPPMLSRPSGCDSELRRIRGLLSSDRSTVGGDRPGGGGDRPAAGGERPAATLPIAAIVGHDRPSRTELALQAAHQLAADYPDGQLYADLRGGEAQPMEVLRAFLRAFGMSVLPGSAEEGAAWFRSVVAGRGILLLLDDAGSFDQIWPLLPGGSPCAVLVTGRERPAGLADHQLVRLPVPGGTGTVPAPAASA